MSRWPSGSVLLPSFFACSINSTRVVGTVVVSTIRLGRRRVSVSKYAAASRTSSSVTPVATACIALIIQYFEALLRVESRNARTCASVYAAGKPASVPFSGRPAPFGKWQ